MSYKMETTNGKGFALSYAEFFYLLFKSKKCPKCGNKMQRYSIIKMVSIVEWREYRKNRPLHSFSHGYRQDAREDIIDSKQPNRNVIELRMYNFKCPSCHSEFPISELATM